MKDEHKDIKEETKFKRKEKNISLTPNEIELFQNLYLSYTRHQANSSKMPIKIEHISTKNIEDKIYKQLIN